MKDCVGNKKENWMGSIWVSMLLTVILMALGQILGHQVDRIPYNWDNDFGNALKTYVAFIGIWIVIFLFAGLIKSERGLFQKLWIKRNGNTFFYLFMGFLVGFGMNAICALVAWLHHDIELSVSDFQIEKILLILVAVFIQSGAEELLCRGFLYERLRKRYASSWIAVFGNALLFALLHLLNPGITVFSVINIFLIGVFFSLMVYYYDSIWCAMAVHAAWNFTQNIVFGLPNSGIVSSYSVFSLDAKSARNSFAYHTAFGIEGTALADFVLLFACVMAVVFGEIRMRKQRVGAIGEINRQDQVTVTLKQ